MRWLILDAATTAIDGVDGFLDEPSAPSNYKDPEKIAAYIANEKVKQVDRSALDPDLGRLTAIGLRSEDAEQIHLCYDEAEERAILATVAREIRGYDLLTFNGHRFDLPCLMRRARYLGVPFPAINLDRYKTMHCDLSELLTNRGALPSHSLGFYVKRLGWTDLAKPLSGAEESRVPQTGRWDELVQSVRHDLTATYRLAQWLGVIPASQPEAVSA